MITLENISIAFGSRSLLKDANATFGQGMLIPLIGRNGAGKSSLLKVLAAIDTPKSGRVLVSGKDIFTLNPAERSKIISFVSTQRVRVANMLCRDVVAIGRAPYTNWVGSMQPDDVEIVNNALAAVGMTDFAARPIDTLSDGECQRVMIARALAQQTPVILLDEPTAFLDIPNRFEICRLLAHLAQNQGKTIIFSTHDIDAALPVCDAIAVIDNDQIRLHSVTSASEVLKELFSL